MRALESILVVVTASMLRYLIGSIRVDSIINWVLDSITSMAAAWRCLEMLGDAWGCLGMLGVALRCSEMLWDYLDFSFLLSVCWRMEVGFSQFLWDALGFLRML